jgi:hypothetical protein
VKSTRFSVTVALAFAPSALSVPARAEDDEAPERLPIVFSADEVHFDVRSKALAVAGHVRVDEPPFHFASPALELDRVPMGVDLKGRGKLSFCPCLGTPLAVEFSGATLAPPDDVILRNPVLEVFGLPVAWAPAFWLRSPGRIGLLPPEVAWRGIDGFFAGAGVHLPWTQGDTTRGLDLRAGGYVDGGVVLGGTLHTESTLTHIRWDQLHGDGLEIEGHGAVGPSVSPHEGIVWDVDFLRGARAVRATTDVDSASRGFDRVNAEFTWRSDGWTAISGVRTVTVRGGPLDQLGAAGPVIGLRRAAAFGSAGAYDVTFEGGDAAGVNEEGATVFARAEGGLALAAHLGAVGGSLVVRGLADAAESATQAGWDGAAQVRAGLSLPFERAFASDDPGDPWIHRTEPRIEFAALATHVGDVLPIPPGRGMETPAGEAWVAAVGWTNGFGRWGSRAAGEVQVTAGAVGDALGTIPALRGHAAVSGPWMALDADAARIVSPHAGSAPSGAFLASARLGRADGLDAVVHVAERDGVDPILARALVDAPLEPSSGFFVEPGWTGGARVGLPWGSRVTTKGGADVDLAARKLVAVVGAVEFHDPCRCAVLRVTAAHRVGRPGTDVWVSVDLPFGTR